ncbi:hypothetical protein PVOR_15754 [Paenibacillus vortex V453]|uniref:Uncharacterized protein n=1 Tax=Paenibacillus vortex V453 TaxID=715225 RepID=A0A2R9SUR2_9BACL|nr:MULTISPECIES: hypothetical protein [Paenibacillus]ANA82411.1 hypothetical protein A3958_21630 [Paenibacillus glucanolyticus]AVV58850.1 hypothetical protein C7121_23365 [Paenibacillus glucanolyticus]EFU41096.1 hypothetical protein PVOR_15754 [Paenibacillus vortex V453]ETT41511.1 hypothetical protein C169_06253 [Paenibacillus sp. FSL R5-808]MDH6672195.1 hypothetical protein [Paenibacillus sp. LBL]
MNWHFVLITFLLIVVVTETRHLIRLRSLRDMIVFYAVWGLTLLAIIGDMLELTELRPLDWISIMMQPLNRLIS